LNNLIISFISNLLNLSIFLDKNSKIKSLANQFCDFLISNLRTSNTKAELIKFNFCLAKIIAIFLETNSSFDFSKIFRKTCKIISSLFLFKYFSKKPNMTKIFL